MTPQIFNLERINSVLKDLDPIQSIDDGFISYFRGKVTAPPAGELLFEDPPGEVHIKYGAISGDEYFVITAMESDTSGKNELNPRILKKSGYRRG